MSYARKRKVYYSRENFTLKLRTYFTLNARSNIRGLLLFVLNYFAFLPCPRKIIAFIRIQFTFSVIVCQFIIIYIEMAHSIFC